MTWSDWFSRGTPSIGDYIQVIAEHKVSSEEKSFEGTVGGEFRGIIWFAGELPSVYSEWSAVRWRKRLSGVNNEKVKEVEFS